MSAVSGVHPQVMAELPQVVVDACANGSESLRQARVLMISVCGALGNPKIADEYGLDCLQSTLELALCSIREVDQDMQHILRQHDEATGVM